MVRKGMVDEIVEVDICSIRNSLPEAEKTLVRLSKNSDLPLHELSWKEFEYLCLDLFESEICHDGKTRAFRYGKDGQAQSGFDLISFSPSDKTYAVAECKRRASVSSGDIRDWVNKFLSGDYNNETKKFILIVSNDIEDTKVIESWHKAVSKLSQNKIDAELWDRRILLKKLRFNHTTVETFYGQDVRDRFCLDIFSSSKERHFKNRSISRFENQLVLNNVKVQVSMFLPSTKNQNLSYAINFSRADINGVTVSGDGEFLVSLMQHRKHCNHIADTPYFYLIKETGRYVFIHPTMRLCLTKEEMDHLDWAMLESWNEYIKSAENLDKAWRCIRFHRRETEQLGIVLFEMDRWFWEMMVQYANTHDYENGDGNDYIFSASGYIQVYLPSNRPHLKSGYHLALHAVRSASIYSDTVKVIWSPSTESNSTYGKDGYWNAEYTFQWLSSNIIPKAYDFSIKEHENKIKRGFLTKINPFAEKIKYKMVEDIVKCKAKYDYQIQNPKDQNELIEYTSLLQNYFYSRRNKSPLEKNLKKCTVDASIRLLQDCPEFSSSYIKGNLGLKSKNIYEEIANPDFHYESISMDLLLRSILSICESDLQFSKFSIDDVSILLKPVWDRYEEELICQTYC